MTFLTDLLPLPPGLVAVIGDERSGKTTLLRRLAGDLPVDVAGVPLPDALWLDPALPGWDGEVPAAVWRSLQQRCPRWDAALQRELVMALDLQQHLGKTLSMMSTGSRRKVALVGLLAAGTTVTCLDQPYAALDARSVGVLRGFLAEAAAHDCRTWVVADHVADPRLRWRRQVVLA